MLIFDLQDSVRLVDSGIDLQHYSTIRPASKRNQRMRAVDSERVAGVRVIGLVEDVLFFVLKALQEWDCEEKVSRCNEIRRR
jgi:hypothetical protein